MALDDANRTPIKYKYKSGGTDDYPYTGNRLVEGNYISSFPIPATEFTGTEGRYTDPNLHRRIDNTHDAVNPPEYQNRDYTLHIQKYNSYRTITHYYHDEDSTESEIP